MKSDQRLSYIENVLINMPQDWLSKTTHRLDIYNESLAKVDFIQQFESLAVENKSDKQALAKLPTAFDYIRLGHPLSCVLEWLIAGLNNLEPENVISFSSRIMPVLAVLRHNLLKKIETRILYKDKLPTYFDEASLKNIYGYSFELVRVESFEEAGSFEGSTIALSENSNFKDRVLNNSIDIFVSINSFGSVVLVSSHQNKSLVSEIQHVRRRESIAMTPVHCVSALKSMVDENYTEKNNINNKSKNLVLEAIKRVTKTNSEVVLGSSGLSVQYAILMGLVDDALKAYPNKKIHLIVPPNCYGGTNDQARRVAACVSNVEIVDLLVDDGNNMVSSLESILSKASSEDVVPYIIAEIPTNPRVEVPNLLELEKVLSKVRKTKNNSEAAAPVFILDQTFCPNVDFLSDTATLSSVKTIAYVSGSKFPSGGKCTAGYCVANKKAESLMAVIDKHIKLCDNEATSLQLDVLAEQLPSMAERIIGAYKNTREFVNFITEQLPDSKINFVSKELADMGFKPSVFSLDLPTKGNTAEEKENYKRELNHKLIKLMIKKIPDESIHCVSYGQLKGCYWTIPATSTQGTTKENDKDYIVRVAVSPDLDLELHKKVFLEFVNSI